MPKLGEVTPFVGDKKVLAAYVGDTLVQYAGGLGGTVLLNARDNTIHPDVTFSRANAGMVCDEQGNWSWELFERTNLFPNSNSYNPSFSAGSGLTGEVVGTGMLGGLRYVDYRVSGTFSGGWTEWTIGAGILNMSDNVHTASVYAQILSGGTEPKIRFRPFFTKSSDSSRAWITSNVYLQTDATRHVWTSGEDVKQFNLLVACEAATGSSVDVTFRVWGLQVETGPTATTPIPTNGAPVTVPGQKYRRSYDVQTKEWGYLFEPQRTNLFGEIRGNFDGCTVTTGAGIKGLNSLIMTKLANSKAGWISSAISTAAGTTTATVWIKKGVGTVSFGPRGGYPSRYDFSVDSASGSIVYSATGGSGFTLTSSSVSDMGSCWKVVATFSCGAAHDFFIGANGSAINGSWEGGSSTEQVSEVAVQYETGPVATSPIATDGAAKTVAADVCTYQNNVLTDAGGTVLVRCKAMSYQAGNQLLTLGGSGNSIGITPNQYFGSWDGTSAVNSPPVTPYSAATGLVSWNDTSRTAASASGENSGTRAANFISEGVGMRVGYGSATQYFQGYINHLSVFPTQLTAEQRAALVKLEDF